MPDDRGKSVENPGTYMGLPNGKDQKVNDPRKKSPAVPGNNVPPGALAGQPKLLTKPVGTLVESLAKSLLDRAGGHAGDRRAPWIPPPAVTEAKNSYHYDVQAKMRDERRTNGLLVKITDRVNRVLGEAREEWLLFSGRVQNRMDLVCAM